MRNELFITRDAPNEFSVRRPGSERASATATTEADAVSQARTINPSAKVYVEIERDENRGGRERWREVGNPE